MAAVDAGMNIAEVEALGATLPGALVNDVFDITGLKSALYGEGRLVMEFSANAGPPLYHGGGGMLSVRVALPDHIEPEVF